ncbi:hypothetical protein BCR44DRAFT_75973 [Catenaria anguillulae PL171]|uniref:Uncharacterized protein n=1 Tax=Catenaria anguillulae PL171 TaxID=765915 RepID=A0A1Y2HZJ3_9FUNG|nr:hypothetical protein BCR44DRAFT_75973 [Catenaria anguillulae PL171]
MPRLRTSAWMVTVRLLLALICLWASLSRAVYAETSTSTATSTTSAAPAATGVPGGPNGQCGGAGCQLVLNNSLNPNKTTYSAEDQVAVQINVYSTSVVAQGNSNTEVTSIRSAMFFPRIAEYSKLTVPNTYTYLQTQSNVTVSLALVHQGRKFELPAKRWWNQAKGWYIPYRTVIISLFQGSISYMEWEPTKCYFTECGCLDDLCPVQCQGDTTKCNIQVHIGFAGSDVNGKFLDSSMKSIWKLQNVI